jgi:hypothetical protein
MAWVALRIEIPALDRLVDLLTRWSPCPPVVLEWHVGPMQPKERKTMPVTVQMTTEDMVRVAPHPMSKGGHAATLDGAPTYTVASGDVTLQPDDADPNATWILSGAMGQSVVHVSADADLGEGVVTIEDDVTVDVIHADAIALGMEAEAPVVKP